MSIVEVGNEGKAFEKSAYLAARYQFVPEADLRAELERLFSLLGVHDRAAIRALAAQKIQRHKLWELRRELQYVTPGSGEDDVGRAARDFFAAQVLFGLLEAPLDPNARYPAVVERLLRKGAEGLFKVGEAQFHTLGKMACDVTEWVVRRGLKSLAIVESPLGNSLPSQVLEEVARQRGLSVSTVEWGCPRNDRAWRGNTVKSAAKKLSADARVKSADCIFFGDDALTGSRVLKMASELRAAVGPSRFAAVAMTFRFPCGSGQRPVPVRDLTRFDEWAQQIGLPYGVLHFPELPLFSIDQGGHVYLEKPMAWGDTDLVAGKRKVNLVFNFIDHYEAILSSIASGDPHYVEILERKLWNRDVDGREYAFAPGLSQRMFRELTAHIDVGALFSEIRELARLEFPKDYENEVGTISSDEARTRSTWLKHCIAKGLEGKLKIKEAGVLSRAVTEIHEAGLDRDRRASRDHDYGHYTIPWNATVSSLNRRLRELIVASAPCVLKEK